jgi:hypothetical protein
LKNFSIVKCRSRWSKRPTAATKTNCGDKDDNYFLPLITCKQKPMHTVKILPEMGGEAIEIAIWPNPASTTLMVTLQEFVPNQKMELTLMQADGKVQTAQSLIPTRKVQQVQMNVSRMAAGYYLLLAKQQGMAVSKRVVILR